MPLRSTVAPYPAQIRLLREIAGLSGLPLEEKLARVLTETASLLDLEVGFFSRIEGETYLVEAVYPADGACDVGDRFRLGETYCDITASTGDVVRIDEMRTSEYAGHPCYEAFGLEAYIGAPVHVAGRFFGTLCFASEAPRERPFSDADAELLRLLASWVGTLVERSREADAARQTERRLATVLDAAPEAVVLTGVDRTIEYVNPAFEALFGFSSDEARGRPTLDFYADPSEFERQGRLRFNAASTLRSDPYIVEYRRADGSTFVGETVGGPVEVDGEVTGMLGFIRDVTEREAAREREAAAARAEAEAVRAKERFLANMSHEMRTPLNAVLGLGHLLGQTDLTDDQAGLLDGVTTAAGALLGLIDDLLDFARLGEDRLPLESIPFSPAEVAGEVRTMLRPQAEEKGLSLRFDVEAGVPAAILGDPTRFRQILLNLVSNALKFTAVGGVRVGLQAEGGRLRVEVTDTGIGIAPDRVRAIFDPFTQASSDATRRFGGTGLGLAIVKELVERQGGEVRVESVEGEGSTFRVDLPARAAVAERPAPAAAPGAPADLEGLDVLLVEDNEMNRLVARRMLEGWGVRVAEARDGHEAVRAVAEMDRSPIDVVLMDLQMPEMDGVAATRYIRDVLGVGPDALPIVALTASVLASQQEDIVSAGLDDFILKPFDPDVLRQRIGEWAGRLDGEAAERAIDPDELLHYTGSDAQLASQVAGLFITNGQGTADRLADGLKAGDPAEIEAAAHALKGKAGYVGATALVATTARILEALRADDRVAVASEVPLAVRQYGVAAAELARLYPQTHLAPSDAATA